MLPYFQLDELFPRKEGKILDEFLQLVGPGFVRCFAENIEQAPFSVYPENRQVPLWRPTGMEFQGSPFLRSNVFKGEGTAHMGAPGNQLSGFFLKRVFRFYWFFSNRQHDPEKPVQ